MQSDNGKDALWLRNVPTSSDARIVEPSGARYSHMAFSPDGNYLYFLEAADNTSNNHNLYRAPVLGGEPRQIGPDIDSDIAFSSDGNRMAYSRGNDPTPESRGCSARIRTEQTRRSCWCSRTLRFLRCICPGRRTGSKSLMRSG